MGLVAFALLLAHRLISGKSSPRGDAYGTARGGAAYDSRRAVALTSTRRVRFFVEGFPLIVTVSAPVWDAAEVRALIDGFEPYFQRSERYAVLAVPTPKAPAPGHIERKLLGEWTSHPRVREAIKRLCVASATVVPSALERAALSIIWAFGKPPCPSEAVGSIERGLDFCLERMREEGLQLPKPPDLVRYETLRTLNGYFAKQSAPLARD